MKSNLDHSENKPSPGTVRGRATVAVAVALVLLTVLASLAVSTSATAAPVVPAELIEEPSIGRDILDEHRPLVPVEASLKASVRFPCYDDHTGAVARFTIGNTSSEELGFSVEVRGPDSTHHYPTDGSSLPTVLPESARLYGVHAGDNGDFVEAWVRDAHGNTLAHEQLTVDCGQPEPSATVEVVCDSHDVYVVVTLANAGTAPVDLDVYFVLASLEGVDVMPATKTVNPGENVTIEYPVEEGESYSVRVFVTGHAGDPLLEDTITAKCYHEPTPPDPKPTPPDAEPTPPTYTPPPTSGGIPRFTG